MTEVQRRRYAYQVFTWVDFSEKDKAYTISGFLNHRHTFARTLWGKVLQGTDQQIADAAQLLQVVSTANNAMTEAEVRSFCLAMVAQGLTEELLNGPLYPKDLRLSFFRAGLEHAKQGGAL